MHMSKEKWVEAFAIGSRIPSIAKELESELLSRANVHLRAEKYAEAEKLFVAVGRHDSAITMYGEAKHYDDMLRLVAQFHHTHLQESYEHVAGILNDEDNCRGAEIYFIKAGQYESVSNMYLSRNLFEDAVRVSKSYGPPDSYKNVLYKWAKALGVELGCKLLYRNDLIEQCLQFYCSQHEFEFATGLAKIIGGDKVNSVLYEHAQFAEESDDLEVAVKCYIDAGVPGRAVKVYLHHKQFDKAIQLAEEQSPNELELSYMTYGEHLFKMEAYSKFEDVMLRAERADVVIRLYKEKGMWDEAFQICKDYAPNLMGGLEEAYDASELESGPGVNDRDSTKIINRGRDYERYGQNEKAIECYLKLTPNNTKDGKILLTYWKRAAELAVKFLEDGAIHSVVTTICPYLTSIGQFHEAASICMDANMTREALEILISGGLFEEAEEIANDMEEEIQEYVKERHTAALKVAGRVDELTSVNLDAALELLFDQGKYDLLIEKARANPTSLSFYIGKYAAQTIGDKEPLKALRLYHEHGVPLIHSHANVIRNLALAYFSQPLLDEYETNVMLRDILFGYLKHLNGSSDVERDQYDDLDRLLFITCLYTNRSAFRNVKGFETICTKISISLLRYGDTLPVERSFFDAGIYCKDMKWKNMALVFLNRYLDIFDAVEDGRSSTASLDSSTVLDSDIPAVCTLPNYHTVSQEEHEEAKDWVLSSSMDRAIVEVLQRDERNQYEAELRSRDGNLLFQPCVITGYPVISNRISFESGRQANHDDWNKFVMALKTGSNHELAGISRFINKWCGNNLNFDI